jgi:AcrR family transcriptional regulator
MTATAAKYAKSTLGPDDWIDAAIDVMVQGSVEKVTVDRLGAKLGVSRGSFYWHFKSRGEFLQAILERWIQTSTIAVQEHLDHQEPDAKRRLLLYMRLPLKSSRSLRAADLELAILGWARRSELAHKTVARVDAIRTAIHTRLFGELGFGTEETRIRAHMTYSFMRYIAWRRDMDVASRLELVNSMHASLVASKRSSWVVSKNRV